VSSRHAV